MDPPAAEPAPPSKIAPPWDGWSCAPPAPLSARPPLDDRPAAALPPVVVCEVEPELPPTPTPPEGSLELQAIRTEEAKTNENGVEQAGIGGPSRSTRGLAPGSDRSLFSQIVANGPADHRSERTQHLRRVWGRGASQADSATDIHEAFGGSKCGQICPPRINVNICSD